MSTRPTGIDKEQICCCFGFSYLIFLSVQRISVQMWCQNTEAFPYSPDMPIIPKDFTPTDQ